LACFKTGQFGAGIGRVGDAAGVQPIDPPLVANWLMIVPSPPTVMLPV
jgi:hypothetical protein